MHHVRVNVFFSDNQSRLRRNFNKNEKKRKGYADALGPRRDGLFLVIWPLTYHYSGPLNPSCSLDDASLTTNTKIKKVQKIATQ